MPHKTDVSRREEYRVVEAGDPISHYTDAVRAGDVVFLSGCGANDADGKLIGRGDVREQARQVLRNIDLVLASANCAAADICKLNIYLISLDDWRHIADEVSSYLGKIRPTIARIEVSQLATPGLRVEIEAVAIRSQIVTDG